MKKVNHFKRLIMNIITSPINIIANIGALLVVIGIRALNRGKKLHTYIEAHENAKIKRK